MTAYELWMYLGSIIADDSANRSLPVVIPVHGRTRVFQDVEIAELENPFRDEIKRGSILHSPIGGIIKILPEPCR